MHAMWWYFCFYIFLFCSFATTKRKRWSFKKEEADDGSRCMLRIEHTFEYLTRIHLFASSLCSRSSYQLLNTLHNSLSIAASKSKPWIYLSSFFIDVVVIVLVTQRTVHIFASKLLIICFLKREKTICYSYFNE